MRVETNELDHPHFPSRKTLQQRKTTLIHIHHKNIAPRKYKIFMITLPHILHSHLETQRTNERPRNEPGTLKTLIEIKSVAAQKLDTIPEKKEKKEGGHGRKVRKKG